MFDTEGRHMEAGNSPAFPVILPLEPQAPPLVISLPNSLPLEPGGG